MVDMFHTLPSDIVRDIYSKYAVVRDDIMMNECARGISRGLGDAIARAMKTQGRFAHHVMTGNPSNHFVIFLGHVRVYGKSSLITFNFYEQSTSVVLKVKSRDGVYMITDCDHDVQDIFIDRVIFFAIQHFNELAPLVNHRRPPKKWIQFRLRDVMLSELSEETDISEFRLKKILDC